MSFPHVVIASIQNVQKDISSTIHDARSVELVVDQRLVPEDIGTVYPVNSVCDRFGHLITMPNYYLYQIGLTGRGELGVIL